MPGMPVIRPYRLTVDNPYQTNEGHNGVWGTAVCGTALPARP